jgi:hypothetical protein
VNAPPAADVEERIPWEERGTLGIATAFMRTLTMAVRTPSRFYALTPRDGSVLPAIAFGLVFALVVAGATFARELIFGEAELSGALAAIAPQLEAAYPGALALIERIRRFSTVASFALAPLEFVLELYVTVAMTWIGLRLTKTLKTPFGVLVRLFAYASWVQIFGLVGVPDEVLLSFLSFCLTFGLACYYWVVVVKASQGIDTNRAVVASIIGGLVALAIAIAIGTPLVIAIAWWGLSKLELPF